MDNPNKIIGLDMDGVILDHSINKINTAKIFGIDLDLLDTPSDIMRSKIDYKTFREIQAIIYGEREMLSMAPLMEGVEDTLRGFKENGVKYYLLSAQKKPELAIENLKERGLWDAYFDSDNAHFVADRLEKDKIARKLGLTDYIDDDPSVLSTLSVKNKYLFDPIGAFQPDENYIRVVSWPDFFKAVQ